MAYLLCSSCGASILLSDHRCSNCGRYNTMPTPVDRSKLPVGDSDFVEGPPPEETGPDHPRDYLCEYD